METESATLKELEERCKISTDSLPECGYRDNLERLHSEMILKINELERVIEHFLMEIENDL